MGHKIYKQRRGRVIMPLYYTPEPINKVAPVKVKPTKTSARSMTNNVDNYNNWAKTQAGAQGHTNIDSQEYTRRQTVNATRKLRGLGDKYPMPKTSGTKQRKQTIGAHRGNVPTGASTSGKGAGAKGVKSKPAGKKTTGKKTPKPEGWVNPNRHKPKVVIGSGEMNLTTTGGSEGYKAHQKEMQEKHTRKRIDNQAKKSLDMIQGTFQGMLTVLKLNRAPHKTSRKLTTEGEHSGKGVRGGNTQFEGTQVMERNRGGRTVIRDPTGKPKERKAGKLNYQTNIGAASTLKTYSFDSLDTSLDTLKALGDNERYNKKKFPKITTDVKKLPKGGDDSRTPKALGESRADQQVMQS
jgi:hypothetical protein